MVTFDISIEDLSNLVGRNNTLSLKELDELLQFCKAEIDSDLEEQDENGHSKISVEVKDSNRPDLWSVEGLARDIRGALGKLGLCNFKFPESSIIINVKPEMKEVRPYIAALVAKGIKFDDFLIKQVIQFQEKIDLSYGRKRKKSSIGIYNLNLIQSPIEYKLVERNFKFTPLQFEEELDINEILEQHPKGIEYGHILSKFSKVPILLSKKGVLSLPPIINSSDVGRITLDTTDVLVEVTGNNEETTLQVIDIFAQNLRMRGARVETVEINYIDNNKEQRVTTPRNTPKEITVHIEKINKYLGFEFSTTDMEKLLLKRRHDVSICAKKQLKIKYGPWRDDILHWVDISEEVAIAYGYNNFIPKDLSIFTKGGLTLTSESENLIRKLLIGFQLQEVFNYSLTDVDTITKKVLREISEIQNNVVKIKNPITRTYEYLRGDLLSGIIRFVSRNSESSFPHHLFETGECVLKQEDNIETFISASVVLAGTNETFETAYRILDALLFDLSISYNLSKADVNFYIDGRSANIISQGKICGHIGEINPQILNNYGILVPISGFEINLSKIPSLGIKSYFTKT